MSLIEDPTRPTANPLVLLGRKIKVARVAADMKQDELGLAVGVSRSAVGLWEKGETEPSASKLFAIARATHQRVEWFAEGFNAETASTEVEAVSSLSQHSVRPKGLEPLTFCFGDTAPFWTPERSLILAAMWCQVEPDAEIAHLVGSAS